MQDLRTNKINSELTAAKKWNDELKLQIAALQEVNQKVLEEKESKEGCHKEGGEASIISNLDKLTNQCEITTYNYMPVCYHFEMRFLYSPGKAVGRSRKAIGTGETESHEHH